MTKLLGSLALAAMAVALTPKSALAEQGVPIKASFTVAFTRTLNTSNATYCGTAVLAAAVAANGAGYSSLGALSFELQKTLTRRESCRAVPRSSLLMGTPCTPTTQEQSLGLTARGRSRSPEERADSWARRGVLSLRVSSWASIQLSQFLEEEPSRTSKERRFIWSRERFIWKKEKD